MLRVEGVSVSYRDFEAVHDVSFEVSGGQWLMLAGPNGAGKSTLLKAIAKVLRYQGKVYLDGMDTARLKTKEMARRMGVLHQHHTPGYPYTVEQLVGLGRYAHQSFLSHADPDGRRMVDEALALCGLSGLRRQNVLTLSGGELQRAFLAQVFAQGTRLLLLDEPASHLDLAYQRLIFDTVRDWLQTPGRAVMSVVHDLQLARRYGTHALFMKQGRSVAFGTRDSVFTRENLQAVWDMKVGDWFIWLNEPWLMDKKG